jgi:hypothetical protein
MLKNKSTKYILIGAISLTLLASILTTINVLSQQGQSSRTGNQLTREEIDDEATPIVDFEDAETITADKSSQRILKNARHDRSGFVINQPGASTGNVRMYDDPGTPLSDLPVGKSEVIVEGTVISSEAFLSNDKSGVYSEFAVRVSKVMKNSSGQSVAENDTIVTERAGGRVRYPSGKIVRYRVMDEGSPIKGARYLFFLRKAALNNYRILTAYELQGNKVLALDGVRMINRGAGQSIFEKHNGKALGVFMEEVTKALQSSNPSKNRTEGDANE